MADSSDEHCKICKQELRPVTQQEIDSLHRRKTAWDIKMIIRPDEPFLMRMIKHIGNTVQLIFLGIISFIMWLIAMSPG